MSSSRPVRRAWRPMRAPDVGSATSGQLAASASSRAAGPASSPATTTVRGPSRSTSPSVAHRHRRLDGRRRRPSAARKSAGARVSWGRAAFRGRGGPPGRSLGGRAGPRVGSGRCHHVSGSASDGSRSPSSWTLSWVGPRREHACATTKPSSSAGQAGRQVVARREDPEDAGLVGGLVGARAAQPVGPVGADDDERAPRVVRLHDRRQQVADGGARRRDDGDRSS